MRYILAIVLAATLVCGCTNKKENQPQASSTSLVVDDYSNDYYPSSSNGSSSSSNTGFQTATSNSTYVLPQPAVMDDAEDAFEEGASLAEEDRMNGTRSHVGGDYNGYDDEYDDGYDE